MSEIKDWSKDLLKKKRSKENKDDKKLVKTIERLLPSADVLNIEIIFSISGVRKIFYNRI